MELRVTHAFVGTCIAIVACGGSPSGNSLGQSGSGSGRANGTPTSGSGNGGANGSGSGSGSGAVGNPTSGSNAISGSSGGSSGFAAGLDGGTDVPDSSATGGEGGAASGSSSGSSTATGPAPTSDSASKQGSCTVQTYTSGLASAADYVTPTVYYPTDCPAPFAGVAVIPGFTEAQSAVNQWGTFLASHGIVVMCVDTAANGVANTGVQPSARASGLIEAVATLKGENTRSGSPLAGKLDTSRMAIMGHSMGGGGTLIAANTHPELKAAIGLCPWTPGGTYPTDTVPTLFFDDQNDGLVPPSAATAEYQSIPTTTHKAYAEFNTAAGHFVANTPLGTNATDPVVARTGLSWLEVYLVGDTRYQQFLAKDPAMTTWDMKP